MEREDLQNQIRSLRDRGKTLRAIASELGTNRSTVHRVLRTLDQRPARQDDPSTESGTSSAPTPTQGVFVGRQREMADLKSALEAAFSGQGQLVMLAGESGIGKTRTARELADYAESLQVLVLSGWCYEEEGAPPYWPWIQIIRSYVSQRDPEQLRQEMGPGASDIAEIAPEIRGRLPGVEHLAPGDSPEQARFRLFDSISTFLRRSSETQPLMLVLDDLHWADKPTLLLLQFLSRQLESTRILVVGCYRDVEVHGQHPLVEALAVVTREPAFRRHTLRGLSLDDTRRFVAETTGTTPSQRMTETIHSHTEGNPFFMSEVIRLLEDQGAVAADATYGNWSLQIPAGVRDVIRQRLNRLSSPCQQTLTTASVIGREFDFKLLRELDARASEGLLLDEVEEALAAHWIEDVPGAAERYQFSHALVQQALCETLPTGRKLRLHARIGQALEGLYHANVEGHASELAYHFAEAQTLLGPEKPVRYSLLAGEQALAAYAYEEALGHFERALATREGQSMDAEMAAMLFGLTRAQGATLELHQIPDVFTNLKRCFEYYLQAGDVDQAVAVAQHPIQTRASAFRPQTLPIFTQALALVPPDSHEAGRLLARHGMALGMEEGDYHGAQQSFSHAQAIARSYNDVSLEMRTLSESAYVDIFHLQYEQCLEKTLQVINLARSLNDLSAEVAGHYWAYMSLRYMGNVEEAWRYASAMVPLAQRLRDRFWLASAFSSIEILARLTGQWSTARDFSDRGLETAPHDVRLLSARALLEYELGNLEEGRVFLERLLGLMQNTPPAPTLVYSYPALVIPLVARVTGLADKLDVAERAASAVLSDPSAVPYNVIQARVGLAILKLHLGDTAGAAQQYPALKEWSGATTAGGSRVVTQRVLGLLAAASGDVKEAGLHFEDALALCRKAGYRPELAWTCYDYGDTLLRRDGPGDWEHAQSLLREARYIAGSLGMRPLMERVTALTGSPGAPAIQAPSLPDGLTRREVEVLRMLATGKTDREIAAELCISVTTASTHVRNLLNKTGAANRTEAAAYAARHNLA